MNELALKNTYNKGTPIGSQKRPITCFCSQLILIVINSSRKTTEIVLICITYQYNLGEIMGITSIRITDDVEKPLEILSKKLDRSKNYLINQAIKEFLARQSVEESQWQDTLEALESIKQGKAIDEDDVNAWLNSWGSNERESPPNT